MQRVAEIEHVDTTTSKPFKFTSMSLKSPTQGSRDISDQESRNLNAVEVAWERDSDSEGLRECDENDPKRYTRIRLHQVIYVTETAPIDADISKKTTGVGEGRVKKYTPCLEKVFGESREPRLYDREVPCLRLPNSASYLEQSSTSSKS